MEGSAGSRPPAGENWELAGMNYDELPVFDDTSPQIMRVEGGHEGEIAWVEEKRVLGAYREADTFFISVYGGVDMSNALDLKKALLMGIDSEGIRKMVVDLTRTEYIDSTTLGVLMGGLKRLRPRSHVEMPLVVKVSSPNIAKIFEITYLDKLFDVQTVENPGPPPDLPRPSRGSTDVLR